MPFPVYFLTRPWAFCCGSLFPEAPNVAPGRRAGFGYRGLRARKDETRPQVSSETSRQLRKRGTRSITVPGKHHPLQLTSSRHRSTSATGKVSPDLTHSLGSLCSQRLLPPASTCPTFCQCSSHAYADPQVAEQQIWRD